ncbi:hypothetical protein COX24_00845 [bacterium (Candidatus Gribaldobacteria) CG23_combo_of_CG06-09_8_20_14_all_37_87_8]|uniref:Uncharacterized protein n=1 Tax=bacterium (Candidatus Gribaldobacteria) CG23_combo_of_CG06-09_8_20_14_all_37_87_8 TaxID=2014278 RepID=A0A2G9ZH94_9BACT|nr:MAG: hypothetical protein COX24_00845 [bacterium (Candidatus Gribaldobacteria) CG23_combo_of_CG06-09_8_20_14_all_37_87_8]
MKATIIVLLAGVLLIGAGLFYWYEWRPNEIRKSCERSARVTESWGDVSYETAYFGCLRFKGLEK